MTKAALGFRTYSGWAIAVTVAGLPQSPAVVDRRRMELADGSGRARQPYHAAQKLELSAAAALIVSYQEVSRAMAHQALAAMLEELRSNNFDVVNCGMLLGSGRPLGSLESTLASHALIHTAEGEMFRDAIRCASESCGLRVRGIKERELLTLAATELELSDGELLERITDLGQSVGRPWRQDEKYAALAAWLTLPVQPAKFTATRQPSSRPTLPAQSVRGRQRL